MRWDYGSVYREIRKSKHLSQEQICGKYINRTTLVRFEKNQTIPSYELMRFLLKQVDMTFEEFEYLCNYYQPSQRQQLLYDIDNLRTPTTQKMVDLIKRCHEHLSKEHDDIPVHRRCLILETIVSARTNTVLETSHHKPAQYLWSQIIDNENWYYNDIIIVGSLLHTLPVDTVEKTCDLLLKRLEKYHDFKRIKPSILSQYQFLSYYFLDWKKKEKARFFATKLMELAKQEKRYDQLARAYVYLGLAENKQELIDKGLQILELTDEQHILTSIKSLIKQHQTD
ncbi:TPA: helix-turn-helix domain-containing protein [Streptococcus suis]|uniref:helix-turn-helix domain-containing protein n=1 Tax=Streptococcus suis TaxID=1307 RepID=UPI000CF4275B|nr:helix-turn-helix transcriptional regulator [Streptococcus suis]